MLVKHDRFYFQHDTDETLIAFLMSVKGTSYRFNIYIDLPDLATFDDGCIVASGGYRHHYEFGVATYHNSAPRPLAHSAWNHVVAVVPSSIAGLQKHHPGWIKPNLKEWLDEHWATNIPYYKHLDKWITTGENVWHGL